MYMHEKSPHSILLYLQFGYHDNETGPLAMRVGGDDEKCFIVAVDELEVFYTSSVRPSRLIVKLWPTPTWGGGVRKLHKIELYSVLYVIHKSDMVHVHNAVLLHSLPWREWCAWRGVIEDGDVLEGDDGQVTPVHLT